MFEWLKKIIKPVTDIIDKSVVDRDLKKQLKNDIEKAIMENGLKYEEEVTKRHQYDMQSDSWLSKNIRPLSLVFLLGVFVIITFFDGNAGDFTLNAEYIPVYSSLLGTAFMFYFGSRGAEKIAKIINNKKEKDA